MKKTSRLGRYLITITAFFFLSLQIPDDPDFGLHLGVGHYILSNQSFPRTDLFSFSLPHHPYVYHSWLAQLFITLVYDGFKSLGIDGLIGISVVWTLMATAAIYFLYRLCQSSFWTILSFFVAAAVVFSSIGVRPQLISFLFLVVELSILLWWRDKRDKREKRERGERWLFLLVPLFFLWANLHLGFMAGLLLMVVFLTSETVLYWSKLKNRGMVRVLIVIPLLCFLATLVNPYGFGLYRQAWLIATNPFNLSANLEWVALTSRGLSHWLFAGVVLSLIVVVLRRRKVDWPLAILSLLLFWGALRTTRVVMPFLVVFLPFVAPVLAKVPGPIAGLGELGRYGKLGGRGLGRGKNISRLYLYLLVLLIPLAVAARGFTNLGILASVVSNPKALAARQNYPWEAVQFIKGHEAEVPERLLNYFNWGGYLVWQMPERKVFETGIMDTFQADGRLFLADYFTIVNAKPEWEKLVNTYSIEAVLLPPEAAIIQLLYQRPEWRVAYQDKISILMIKTETDRILALSPSVVGIEQLITLAD